MYAMPSGANKRPSIPGKANRGTNTKTTIKVAYTMPDLTSTEAFQMVSSKDGGLSSNARCFNRRKMFSTSTTASSTNSPIAIANPSRVMTLIDCPRSLNTTTVTASESGIAISEISVVRAFSKKTNKIRATMIAPSRKASTTLAIDA